MFYICVITFQNSKLFPIILFFPCTKILVNGLNETSRKLMHHQGDSISTILKATMVINTQVLFEMETHLLESSSKGIIISSFIHQPCMVMSFIEHLILFCFRKNLGLLCLVIILFTHVKRLSHNL